MIVLVIIIIFLVIFLWKLYNIEKLEHLTPQSDEAVQNLSSLYNKDELTIGKLNIIDNATLNNATIKNSDMIKTNKLQLGDKFIMSGGADFAGNDGWLRFMTGDGKGYAKFAAQSLWTADGTINGRNIFAELDNLQAQINQRVVIGGRYGIHRGSDNSVIWGHGVYLQPCGLGGCPGCPNNCTY